MLLLFLTFFSFLLLSWAIYKVKLVYQIGSSEQNRLFLVTCLGYLTILACFRGMNVGNDTRSYYNLFLFYTGQGTVQNISSAGLRWMSNIEIGYRLLNKYFGTIWHNYQAFISAIAIVSYLVLGRFVKKYSSNVALSVILMFLMFYSSYMNLLRQIIALSIVLLAFDALNAKKAFRFVIGVLVATILFHHSAIICLLLLPMSKSKCSKKFAYLSVAIAALVVAFGRIPAIISFLNITTGYTDVAAGSSIVFSIIKNFAALLFSWYLTNIRSSSTLPDTNNSELNPKISDNLISWIPFICLLISVCALGMPVATRFELYFEIFLIVLIPRMITTSARMPSNIRVVVNTLLLTLLIYNAGKIVYRPEWVTEFSYYPFWSK